MIAISSLLIYVSSFFIILSAVFIAYNLNSEWVANSTLLWNILILFQNIIVLKVKRLKCNPFAIITIFTLLFFYNLRVLSLACFPYSVTLYRSGANFADVNFSLFLIFLCNIFLFAGFYSANSKTGKFVSNYSVGNVKFGYICVILMIMFFFSFLTDTFSLSIFQIIKTAFFQMYYIILFAFSYYGIKKKELTPRERKIFLLIVLIYIFFATITGSRQALLVVFFISFIVYLNYYTYYEINKKYIWYFIGLVPFALFFFLMATAIRGNVDERTIFKLDNILFVVRDFDLFSNVNSDNYKYLFEPIFDRLGFLDYTTEVIKKSQMFSKVISPEYYLQSIIDNVLTPGFNVFDSPLISNTFPALYAGKQLTHSSVLANYQSDQITIYAEIYLLFKYFSCFVFFGIAFLVQKIYNYMRMKDALKYLFLSSFVLYEYRVLYNSFGLDWVFLDLFVFTCTYFLFGGFFYKRYKFKI